MQKPGILIFIDWYLPGYKGGGPIRSCASLIELLKEQYHIYLVCRDRDLGDEAAYAGIQADSWQQHEQGIQVLYLSPASMTVFSLFKILRQSPARFVYLNSFFSYFYSVLPLILCRMFFRQKQVVMAPRGMLDSEALYFKKGKKQIYLSLFRLLGLYRSLRWHATNEQERKSIQSIFGNSAEVRLARNMPAIQPRHILREKNSKTLNLVFVSRIVPIKNLHFALQVLARSSAELHISYDIYGPVDDEKYWEECKQLISTLPAHVKVQYRGVAENQYLPELFSHYHFFFLPTLNENFGHAIMEALACSCPVIITDGTPWHGLEKEYAGWDLPVSQEAKYLELIQSCALMDQAAYNRWQLGAYEKARSYYHNQELEAESRQLFSA